MHIHVKSDKDSSRCSPRCTNDMSLQSTFTFAGIFILRLKTVWSESSWRLLSKESLSTRNRHDWCILWAYSLLKLSLVGLSFPWIFFSFVSPLETKQNQRKPKENYRIHPSPNQRKSKETKGNRRKPKETEGNQRKSKETKGNQRKPKEMEGNQRKSKETKGNQRKPKETKGNRRKSKEIKGNQRKSKETKGNQRKPKEINQRKSKETKGNGRKPKEIKGNQRKWKETKGNQRKPKEMEGNQRKPKETKKNQRKPKETKGNGRKPKEIKGNQRKWKETKGNQRKPKEMEGNQRKPKETEGNQRKWKETKGNQRKPKEMEGNQRKSKETKGNGRKPKEIKGNQRKSKEIKGNQRKPEETEGNESKSKLPYPAVKNACSSDVTKALLWCLVGQTIKISPSLCWCTHLRWPVFVRVSFGIVRYHDRLRDWNLGRRTRFAALLRPYLSVPQLWSFCAGWSCANSRTFWKSSDDPTCIESVCVFECLSARGESSKLGRRAFGLI